MVGQPTRTTIAERDAPQGDGSLAGLDLLVMSLEAFSSIPLERGRSMVIGRSAQCDVQLQDPLVSRQHARLDVGEPLTIEDLNSANRTRVRDVPLAPGTRVTIAPGEVIRIGTTVLVVEQGLGRGGLHRLWSHGHFEAQLGAECARANIAGGRFALVRLRLERPAPWTEVVPILARAVPQPHLFAAYGPHDYEFLLLEAGKEELGRVMETVERSLASIGAPTRVASAWYPQHGRSADALLASANALLRPSPEQEIRVPSRLSRVMHQVQELALRAARSNINVLLVGETGAGKEVLAQTIHRLSLRASKPIVAFNCASLSQNLIESELFGYEKGAFTGATQSKPGLLEVAQGGTVFLDEIGEMPLALQARMLRVIESREVLPVGALRTRPIDVRFIAATNRDLESEQDKGRFRRDLYFRLNGITITVPPLRSRRSEIAELAEMFLARIAQEARRSPPAISPAAMALLSEYDWPGNIRELKNTVERALILCEGHTIDLAHLPIDKMRRRPPVITRGPTLADPRGPGGRTLAPGEQAERTRIIEALEANVWNQSRAARALNMPRRTLVSKLDRFGIPRPQKGPARPRQGEP